MLYKYLQFSCFVPFFNFFFLCFLSLLLVPSSKPFLFLCASSSTTSVLSVTNSEKEGTPVSTCAAASSIFISLAFFNCSWFFFFLFLPFFLEGVSGLADVATSPSFFLIVNTRVRGNLAASLFNNFFASFQCFPSGQAPAKEVISFSKLKSNTH